MKSRLDGLEQMEMRRLLRDMVDLAENAAAAGETERLTLADDLLELADRAVEQSQGIVAKTDATRRNVHLVFSMSDAGSLKVTLSKLGMREESQVLAFDEQFSIAPIWRLDTKEGQQHRELWLMQHIPELGFRLSNNRDHRIGRMLETIYAIPASKTITIWCADNAHDQTGVRFVLHLLRGRKQAIRIANVSEMFVEAFGDEGGRFEPPFAQGQMAREQYVELVRRSIELPLLGEEERRRYEAEWLELARGQEALRLWRDGRIVSCAVDELDEVILNTVAELQAGTSEDGAYVKAGTLLVRLLERERQALGDSFLQERLWHLIGEGKLAFSGLPGAVHRFGVRVR
ncbi:DUF1835 domain-containing protein [Paenibacillus xanthanilyticus]|uniref:DUF1835 domain-containing protein n=1 Tax=Paenibacillus xanthanilyticus TaxID=1783531 RepID=A0ABV8K7V6_9BACL